MMFDSGRCRNRRDDPRQAMTLLLMENTCLRDRARTSPRCTAASPVRAWGLTRFDAAWSGTDALRGDRDVAAESQRVAHLP
jgi:hypothetical protein